MSLFWWFFSMAFVVLERARLWHRPMPQPGACGGLGASLSGGRSK